MDWVWLLFSFRGRINRARFYLAGLVIACWMIFLAVLVIATNKLLGIPIRTFGFDVDDVFGIADPRTYRHVIDLFRMGVLPASGLVPMFFRAIGTLLFLWIYAATSIKRLHDRDKSGWWMTPFFIFPGLYKQFEERLPDSWFLLPVSLAVFAFMIWGFVEMYFLKGAASTNRFGPDPLAGEQSRWPGKDGLGSHGSAWDQQSEIEPTPYRASPPPSMHVKRGHE